MNQGERKEGRKERYKESNPLNINSLNAPQTNFIVYRLHEFYTTRLN